MSSEYFLISAPSDPTCEETYRKLSEVTSNVELTSNYKFSIPDLKVNPLCMYMYVPWVVTAISCGDSLKFILDSYLLDSRFDMY